MHAHLDLFSGIAGDMLLGAIVDAGLSVEALAEPLRSLGVDGWELVVTGKRDPRIGGSKVDVILEGKGTAEQIGWKPSFHMSGGEGDGHHHHGDGDGDGDGDGHHHGDGDGQHHHGHDDDAHAHHHSHDGPHRHLPEILALIQAAHALPQVVRDRACAAFNVLADAESEVHGVPRETVHFHEVGAVDAIIDICGGVLGMHLLGVTSISASPVPLGSGFVTCQHGRIPVPAPATALLLRGLPTTPAEGKHPTGELVTPTGAALLRVLVDDFGPAPAMRLDRVAYGLGTKDRGPIPNAVRLLLGVRADAESTESASAAHEPAEAQSVDALTATLDDLDPRLFGPLMERLFAVGALDVVLRPVQGKKGRPATELVALCPADEAVRGAVARVVFEESTTLGLRWHREQRQTLERRFEPTDTAYGVIPVKLGLLDGVVVTVQPEFDDCVAAANAHSVPVRVVVDAARFAAQANLDRPPTRSYPSNPTE